MIRLKAKQAEKKAEEKEAAATAAETGEAPKPKTKILGIGRGKRAGASKEKKRTPGEIRIQKDIAELDGGKAAAIDFPEQNDLTVFTVKRYRIKRVYGETDVAGACYAADVSARPAQGSLPDENLPPQHRPRRQRVSEHSARGLETRAGHQLGHLWSDLPVLRAQPGRPAE
ncbi:hypothetical protein ON010_g19020 [Phytophthora cinnamomi]|nr:hypothetical protein ON010_g19020 [Phytophthora cinnamomi]